MKEKFDHDEYLKEYKKRMFSRLTIDMKKEKRAEIQRHADLCGETLTGYIKKAVEMRMALDQGENQKQADREEQEETGIASQHEERVDSGKQKGMKRKVVHDGNHGLRVVYAKEEEEK